eukprot:3559028-Prymnesium_polylepis.1
MATLPAAMVPAAAAAADSDAPQQNELNMVGIAQRQRLDVQAVHAKVTEKFDTLSGKKLEAWSPNTRRCSSRMSRRRRAPRSSRKAAAWRAVRMSYRREPSSSTRTSSAAR